MNGYRWLTEDSLKFLEQDYLLPKQSLDERVDIIAETAESILKKKGFANKFKDYMKRGWFSLSTPVWTNFGTERGLPISCFGSYVDDTMESIVKTHAEICMMTKHGGGTAAYFGAVRGRGSDIKDNGKSCGSVHFAKMFDTAISIISQGSTRRGNCSGYWPIEHPDIEEVLAIKSEGHPIQDLSFGVCISDKWMQQMIDGDKAKRRIQAKILSARANIGYPYIIYTGAANRNTVDVYKDLELEILHSQMCTEIFLPTSVLESFVCCISSMNVLYVEEWKNTDAPEVLTYLLDAVLTEFIRKAKKIAFMDRAVRFAERHRALGIGWIGWHSYLQSKMIPFESMKAKQFNIEIAKKLKKKVYAASAALAEEYGEPELLKGYGRRNSTVLATAPTQSSSFILGQISKGIQPFTSNYYIDDLAKGKFTFRNPVLSSLLKAKNKDKEVIWDSILKNSGSVQHLDCLTKEEKDVFKTFAEISPMEIIIQASQRGKYIDQGQSLNLMINPKTPARDVNKLLIEAWKLDIKSLYYQIGVNAAQELSRDILSCTSCES